MGILKKATGLVKVLIHILKKERKKQETLMSVIGSKTKSMELEYKTIQESEDIKAIGKTDRGMEKAS